MQGPDVWEVVSLVRSLDARGEAAIQEVAAWLGLSEAQVRAALGYYGAFPHEIDDRISANEATADHAQKAWETQQKLLA